MAQIDKWLTPEGLAKIGSLAKNGLTNKKIAACMDVAQSTLQKWIKDYPPIALAIRTNREAVYIQEADKYNAEMVLLEKAAAGDANAKRQLMIMYTKKYSLMY